MTSAIHFRQIFGIEKTSVQKTCLLLPFIPQGTLQALGIKELSRGAVFSSASINRLTVIKTGIGSGFTGDAVMYLQGTACRNIFFLGSCGLIHKNKNIHIGDLFIPILSYGFESFSDIMNNRIQEPLEARPDPELVHQFIGTSTINHSSGTCVSFASLYHEENFIPLFTQLDAVVIEMECATFFNASRKTGRKAMALLLVTDILKEKQFFETLTTENKKNLATRTGQAATAIKTFSNEIKTA